MNPKYHTPSDTADVRRRAEQRMRERQTLSDEGRSAADTQRLVHELQVHQIELEMQNEELQRVRDVLEAEMEKYSDLFDFAPVGYLTLDREGTIREVNLTMASLLGIDRSRLFEQRFAFHVVAADRPAFGAFLGQVSATRTREFCEVSLVRNGKPSIEVRLEAALAASGEEYRMAVTDITERNRSERDRLVLSKLESTGILAGGIAHDFNNLLTVILLDLEQTRSLTPDGDEVARLVDDARSATILARGLTQQLITFSRGGAPVRKITSLGGIIQEYVRPALSGSRVQADIVVAEDLWLASLDVGQIGQVMRNLVLNAREAMPEGGVVSIRAENVVLKHLEERDLPPGEYVRVSVEDHGGGIAPDVLPKIFDPYFSTKQRGMEKGMGLGLAICHAVMSKHGGAIDVQTEMGVGTTFHLYFPASRSEPASEAEAAPAARSRCGRILLMDDEEALRRALRTTLRRQGHEVEAVANGELAIESYFRAREQGHPFDLVILDLTVRGGLGGKETLLELRRMDPAVKAVVMTGYTNDPAMLQPGLHGFSGVLAKPFDSAKLEALISRLLGGANGGE